MLSNHLLQMVFEYWSPSKEIKSWRTKCICMYGLIFDLYKLYSPDGVLSWDDLDQGYDILRPHYLNERETYHEKKRKFIV